MGAANLVRRGCGGSKGLKGGAVFRAQTLHHAVDARDVVVGAADELEQTLRGVLPEHPST